MSRKFTSYDDALIVFDEHGLCLDTPKHVFDGMNLQKEKLKCHCVKHPSNPLEYFFSVVKSGRFGCKECRKEKDVKRHDMTTDEKFALIKDKGYTYISGDVIKILNPLVLICHNGHQCFASINDLMRMKCVCNICNGKLPPNFWTIEKCQEWLDNSEIFCGYKILDFQKDRALIKCPIADHNPYWTSWTHIYRDNTICRECYYDRENMKNWTLERAKRLFNEYGYTIVDDDKYISSHKRVPCYDKYGFIYLASVHYILRGRVKFSLWKNNPYAMHNINLYCKLFRPDYEFVSQKYCGSKELHKWRYIGNCIDDDLYDREFELPFGAFVNCNCGHPMLSKSRLEAKCEAILDKHMIEYKTQKTFDGCVCKNKLRFDFYLVVNNEEICIEVDGNQHKYPADRFGGLEGLAERQKRDQIKNEYCAKHNIRLIRIPESKFKHMEEILIKELNLNT